MMSSKTLDARPDALTEIHYPLGEKQPESGRALSIHADVKWLRMALPFALNHINLWLLRDELNGVKGWTVVDCCIAKDESKAQWLSVFENELEGLPILRTLVTHMHPDHIGLASWLSERWNAMLWISSTDYNGARIASASTTGFGGARAAAFFAQHGLVDADSVAKITQRANYYSSMVPGVPPQYRRLLDGMQIQIGERNWTCISGYGHSPEHMAIYCADLGILISGDMLLPKISTNISVYDVEPESDPLPLFLASIDKFTALPEDTLVLPSHGLPFVGIHCRVAALHSHHDARLAEVLEACSERPMSAFDLLPILFRRELDLHQTTFAMGESIAHLHALWFAGKLKRELGEDGVYRFSAV